MQVVAGLRLSLQFIEQRLRLLHICRIEPLGEPTVHRLPFSLLQYPGHQRIERLLLMLRRGQNQSEIPIEEGNGEQGGKQRYNLVQGLTVGSQSLF